MLAGPPLPHVCPQGSSSPEPGRLRARGDKKGGAREQPSLGRPYWDACSVHALPTGTTLGTLLDAATNMHMPSPFCRSATSAHAPRAPRRATATRATATAAQPRACCSQTTSCRANSRRGSKEHRGGAADVAAQQTKACAHRRADGQPQTRSMAQSKEVVGVGSGRSNVCLRVRACVRGRGAGAPTTPGSQARGTRARPVLRGERCRPRGARAAATYSPVSARGSLSSPAPRFPTWPPYPGAHPLPPAHPFPPPPPPPPPPAPRSVTFLPATIENLPVR